MPESFLEYKQLNLSESSHKTTININNNYVISNIW